MDNTFNVPPNVINGAVLAVELHTDDKVLAAGEFFICNGHSQPYITRFNYNGTTDTTTAFASIKGFKENLTNNDYAGALAFMTRVNGGNSTERMRITSVGSIQYSVAYSSGYHMDTTPSQIAVANGGTINFANFSGMVVMNNHSSGGVTIYLMGAGLTTAVASNGTQVGTMAYNGAISGYTWTNNSGGTNIFGAAIIRTRTTA